MCKPKENEKLSHYNIKTADVEVRKVSSERYCSKYCCQIFPQVLTLTRRYIFYLKSFEEKPEYGIVAGGHMHSIDSDHRRRYLTLHSLEVYAIT